MSEYNPKVWTVTEEWSKPHSFTPDYTIKLSKHDKEMGKLEFNGDKLKFEGDVEESAKIFFDFLLSSFNQRIEEIKEEAWRNGYDEAYKKVKEKYDKPKPVVITDSSNLDACF
jgi:hypothetical protein